MTMAPNHAYAGLNGTLTLLAFFISLSTEGHQILHNYIPRMRGISGYIKYEHKELTWDILGIKAWRYFSRLFKTSSDKWQ